MLCPWRCRARFELVRCKIKQPAKLTNLSTVHRRCPHTASRESHKPTPVVPVQPRRPLDANRDWAVCAEDLKPLRVAKNIKPPGHHDAQRPLWLAAFTDFRHERHVRGIEATEFDLAFLSQVPAVPGQAGTVKRVILSASFWVRLNDQTLRAVIRVRCGFRRSVIEEEGAVVPEETATPPAVSLGPEGQRRQVGWAADRCPGVGVLAVVAYRLRIELAGEVDEEAPIWRKIASAFVDTAPEPMARFELVVLRVPED
jgi:hypothetical protein